MTKKTRLGSAIVCAMSFLALAATMFLAGCAGTATTTSTTTTTDRTTSSMYAR